MARAKAVTPAKAGVQERRTNLDSGFRRNDGTLALAFCFLLHIFEYIHCVRLL
jgi:hypothetical protein